MCKCEDEKQEEGLDQAEGRYCTVSNGDGQMAWIEKEERVCKECDSGEVEDVVHWLIRCPAWIGHCEALLKHCHDHSSNSDEDTMARLLCLACHNHKTAADIHTMWKAHFRT